MQLFLRGSEFTLLPEKALYKHDESLLIIADIHLGKASHFRKSGIPMPANAQAADYKALERLFEKVQPEKVYFLGDLFHSTFNGDWHYFAALISRFQQIDFTLIKGNHDLINKSLFRELNITVIDNTLEDASFIYSHAPLSETDGKINISGHIHPGIRLSGQARQSLTIPCYYLINNILLLPAFGVLTGLYIMDWDNAADIYAVLSNEVRKI
ncbi:MAG: ligase-associated DNA damage response endonuclease PdeM [Bacteroidetes bacterium]|nr:ligase-associated DNA damage response endonuclease PdeM [Bacteroidota bacterium]